MVPLGGKDRSKARKPYFYLDVQSTRPLTSKSIENILLLWVVYMCEMVISSGKDNDLEPGNRILNSMSSALDH
jgi:hypothetical protein